MSVKGKLAIRIGFAVKLEGVAGIVRSAKSRANVSCCLAVSFAAAWVAVATVGNVGAGGGEETWGVASDEGFDGWCGDAEETHGDFYTGPDGYIISFP